MDNLTFPRRDGFFMPAEYFPHGAVYMIWPSRPDNWRCGAKFAQKNFARVAGEISKFERVKMLVGKNEISKARKIFNLNKNVEILQAETDDAWARDTSPTFVIKVPSKKSVGKPENLLRGIDWKFNAWGGKFNGLYSSWKKDDALAKQICGFEKAQRYRLGDFVLEGGSIHVDGEGTALTTQACLLSKGRNPQLSKKQIETVLKKYLNVKKVIWLERGIYLDETSEHIDNAACFSSPANVALAWTENKKDPQYAMSKSCYEILSRETDALGRKIKVWKVPLPQPQFMTKKESSGLESVKGTKTRSAGDRLAASYINHYIANGAVICPAFNDPADDKAAKILARLYPNRKIIQVYSREILLGGGNIHCITQQVPKTPAPAAARE